MQFKEFNNVKISGIACAVPNNSFATESYRDSCGDKAVDRFIEATGIKNRYVTDGRQTASDLSFAAAKALMEKKGLTGEDFDAVVMITQTPDYVIPATAFVLHKRLGIRKDCLVFDVNLGCSGYINGIYLLAGLIESGAVERALLLVGDSHVGCGSTKDYSLEMLFGDASSATIIEKGKGTVRGMIRSDGKGYKALITPAPGSRFPDIESFDDPRLQTKMDGNAIFVFAISEVPKLFSEFFECFNTTADDYDYIVLHQANLMIINQIAKKLKVEKSKVPVSLDRYGNTDGASVPVTIADLCEKSEHGKELHLITSGFGIGLSSGVVSFDINTDDVMPMIFTNDYYEDGRNV